MLRSGHYGLARPSMSFFRCPRGRTHGDTSYPTIPRALEGAEDIAHHTCGVITVRDPNQTAAKLYHTDGWPETYIIDRQGIIRRKIVGDPDWSNPELRAYLKTL